MDGSVLLPWLTLRHAGRCGTPLQGFELPPRVAPVRRNSEVKTLMAMRQEEWGWREWCAALASHFFGEHAAQLPVLFFIDEDLLASLHPSGDGPTAVASLAQAVRNDLCAPEPHGYFASVEKRGRIWKLGGGKGDPPFLHLLAVCAFAAARMGTGAVAPNNYRAHLCELLGLDPRRMPEGFRESLYMLWDQLTWWLDEANAGDKGLSTVTDDSHYTHIGYPISQTLFRGSDVRRLDDFFRWMQLGGEEEVDEDLLLAYFRAWAPGKGVSNGAMRLLSEVQFVPTIGRILSAYASQWDGTRAGRNGTRSADLQVVLELTSPVRLSLQALQPPGYPGRLRGAAAGRTAVAVAEDGVFEIQGAVEAPLLLRGVTVESDGCRLSLAGSEIHVLRRHHEFGWASVASLSPGERHCLLVAPTCTEAVQQQLERASVESIQVRSAPGALSAWSVIRNVVVTGELQLTGALADRRPTLRHRFALRGGLPLIAKDSFLSGGAPDVWLPPLGIEMPTLTLDAEAMPMTSERVRLASHLPSRESATHRIVYAGAVERSIFIVESALRSPPAHEQPGHELALQETGSVEAHRAVSVVRDADVTVVGPHVAGPSIAWRQGPVLLPRHAQASWLLGANAGEVLCATPPAEPRWLAGLGLGSRLFEARAPFPAQYAIEQWWLAPRLRLREVGPEPPTQQAARIALRPPDEATDDVATWAALLLEATPTGSFDEALLAEYRRVAAEVGGVQDER